MNTNKYGQNIPLTDEEKTIRGYKRRRLVLVIIVFILIAVIAIQVGVLLTQLVAAFVHYDIRAC